MARAEMETAESNKPNDGIGGVDGGIGGTILSGEPIWPIYDVDPQGAVVMLRPEDIASDPRIEALRGPADAQEIERIRKLADTILEDGQLEDALVRNAERGYVLVYGHRRKAAIEFLGAGHQLRCRVAYIDADEALRIALRENWQRKDFTVLERARQVAMLRETYSWQGQRGTGKVAEYLGVDSATVTQMDRLIALPKEILDRVESGALASARAALELAPVVPEKRAEVVEEAQKLADAEETAKPKRQPAKSVSSASHVPEPEWMKEQRRKSEERKAAAKRSKEASRPDLGEEPPAGTIESTVTVESTVSEAVPEPFLAVPEQVEPAPEPVKPARVEARHVRQAARAVPGATKQIAAPGKAEIVAWWKAKQSASLPTVLTRFVGAHVAWMAGGKRDKWLDAALEDLADAVAKGKKAKAAKPANKAERALKSIGKKLQTQAAGAAKKTAKGSAKHRKPAKKSSAKLAKKR